MSFSATTEVVPFAKRRRTLANVVFFPNVALLPTSPLTSIPPNVFPDAVSLQKRVKVEGFSGEDQLFAKVKPGTT